MIERRCTEVEKSSGLRGLASNVQYPIRLIAADCGQITCHMKRLQSVIMASLEAFECEYPTIAHREWDGTGQRKSLLFLSLA